MEYQYEKRVDERSWFIRLYLWAWRAEVERVDFCRLFWGYVFMAPNLLLRAVVFPFWVLWRVLRVLGRAASRVAAALGGVARRILPEPKPMPLGEPSPERSVPKEPRRQRRRARGEAFLTAVSRTADRGVAACQTAWPYMRWVRFPLRALFWIGAGAFGVALGALACYGFYALAILIGDNFTMLASGAWIGISAAAVWVGHGAWWLAPTVGIILAVAVVILVLLRGGIYVAEDTSVGPAIGRKTVGFAGAMKTGALGVKRRTCPKITVVRDEARS
jgi:hypothetical protein